MCQCHCQCAGTMPDLAELTGFIIHTFWLGFNKTATVKSFLCSLQREHSYFLICRLPLFLTSKSIVFHPHNIFNFHIHSWNNLDVFYSLHTLKKIKQKLPTDFLPHICLFLHPHSHSLTHCFLQFSHPAFELIHCFFFLLWTLLLYDLTTEPHLYLVTYLLSSLLFYFCFFINLSYYYTIHLNIKCYQWCIW